MVLIDFFAIHEIQSILPRNHMSIAASFFCICIEIVQTFFSYRIGST